MVCNCGGGSGARVNGGAGVVYCVEGGPREASQCGSAASKEIGVPW